MATKRLTASFSLYPQHIYVIKKLATQLDIAESLVLREIIELVAGCDGVWSGPFVKFRRPKFQHEHFGEYVQ